MRRFTLLFFSATADWLVVNFGDGVDIVRGEALQLTNGQLAIQLVLVCVMVATSVKRSLHALLHLGNFPESLTIL